MVRRRALPRCRSAKVVGGKNTADERNYRDAEAATFTETIDIPPAVARIWDRLRKT